MAIVYDLDADETGSSFVEEFPRFGPGYQYPIVGNIRITLDPVRPFLENIDSDILPLPNPNVPAPYTPIVWNQLDLFFVGEYLSDAFSADVSMRFYFSPIIATLGPFAPLPPYELFVELTEGRSKLDLTGGYVGITLGSDGAPGAFGWQYPFGVAGTIVLEQFSGLFDDEHCSRKPVADRFELSGHRANLGIQDVRRNLTGNLCSTWVDGYASSCGRCRVGGILDRNVVYRRVVTRADQ